jgi:hypothetical protein
LWQPLIDFQGDLYLIGNIEALNEWKDKNNVNAEVIDYKTDYWTEIKDIIREKLK